MTSPLLVIVSRITSPREELFFARWRLTPPASYPFALFLDSSGVPSKLEQAAVALIDGLPPNLVDRLVTVIGSTGRNPSDAHVLIHTGSGRPLAQALHHSAISLPEALVGSSFALGATRLAFFLAEHLAPHAGSSQPAEFAKNLRTMSFALAEAVASFPNGLADAGDRVKRAVTLLAAHDQARRLGATIGAATLNPVAALAHDILGPFDPLLIDLTSAIDDPSYWTEARSHYKGSLFGALQRLQELAIGGDKPPEALLTLDQVRSLVLTSERITPGQRTELDELFLRLTATVRGKGSEAPISLLQAIDVGTRDSVSQAELRELSGWLESIRVELSYLDRLFRQAVTVSVPAPVPGVG